MTGKGTGMVKSGQYGFTIMELIMVILLLTLLAVIAVAKWPSGLDEDAAVLEFKQAVRYAQHMALTREWTSATEAWGLTSAGNLYSVGRANANCLSDCTDAGCAEEMYCKRMLLGRSGMNLSSASVHFNGLGEPVDSSGGLLGNTTFSIGAGRLVTVCQQTGYVLEGGSCP